MPPTRLTIALSILIVVIIVAGIELFSFSFSSQFESFLYSSSAPNSTSSTATTTTAIATRTDTNDNNSSTSQNNVQHHSQHGYSMNKVMSNTSKAKIKSSSSSSLSSRHEQENNNNNNNNDSEDESDSYDDSFLSASGTENFKWSLDERIRELDKAQENYFIGDHKHRRQTRKRTKNLKHEKEKNLNPTDDDDVHQETSEDDDDEADEEDNNNSPFVSPTIFDAVCSNLAQFYPSVSCSFLQEAANTNSTTTATTSDDYYENDKDTMTEISSSLIPPVAKMMDQQTITPRKSAAPPQWTSPFMKKLLLAEHYHREQNDSHDENNDIYPHPFDSMRSWVKWCAASPLHCYRPECYYPLKVRSHQTSEGEKEEGPSAFLRHRHYHHKSFLRKIDKSNFAAAAEDFQLDPDLIGKGCRPSPFYHPPESMIVRRRRRRNVPSATKQSFSSSSNMRMMRNLTGTKKDNLPASLHHLQKMKPSTLLSRRRRRAKGAKTQHSEFTCLHRKSDSKESHRYLFDHQHQHHDERKSAVNKEVGSSSSSLENFKKRTSWMFSKWYDWNGKCIFVRRSKIKANTNSSFRKQSQKQEEEFKLSGSHSKKDGLYRLKNVCFRPNGGLVGYLGTRRRKFSDVLDPYYGTDDVGWTTESAQANLVDFIQNENNHKRLEKPADCYLDTKVILFPLDWRTDNPGHCFYRTGFTLRCIESAFGRDAMWSKENVTVAYVRVAPADRSFLHTKQSLMKKNMMKYYYDILGTSWFSINGVPPNRSSLSREEKIRVEREMYDGYSPTAEEEQQHEPMACFKEVVIAQSGLMTPLGPETKGQTRRVFFDTNTKINRRTSFNIYGPRSLRDRHTLDILDLKLRSCQNLPPRRRLARFAEKNQHQKQQQQGVRVVFAVRSQYRRLSMQPYLISFLATRVRLEFGDNAILEVIEHSQLTFREIILRYTQADVLIAGYGATLMWSMFLPPKAIVVEIVGFRQGQSRGSGFNINRHTEYGGGSLVQDQFHATIFDPAKFSRWPAGMNYSSDFSDIELSSTLAVNKMDNIISLSGFGFLMPLIGCVAKRLPIILHTSAVLSSDADRIDACAPLPACCQFNDASSLKFLSETPLSNPNVFDRQTVPMLLNLRLFPPPSSPSCDFKVHNKKKSGINSKLEAEHQKNQISFFSPRLEALIRQPSMTDVFVTATKHFAMPSAPAFETAVKILFVEPCGENDDEIRPSIFAEVVALRQVFQRIEHVYVAKVTKTSSSSPSSSSSSSLSSFCDYSLQRDQHHSSSPNKTSGNSPIFSRAKKTFREFLGVERDGEYDAFTEGMFRTCQFPCAEFGPFDLTIHDCFFHDNSAKKENYDDSKKGSTTMAQQCIVNLREPLLHHQPFLNNQRVPPSATEVFTKTTNGLLGVILSFAYDDDTHRNKNKHLKSPTALFAFRGPVLGRLRDDKGGNIITPKMQSVFNLSSVPFAVAASQQKQQLKRRVANHQDNDDDDDVDYEAFHSPILYPSFNRRANSQNMKNKQQSSLLMNQPSIPKYDHTPHIAFVYDDNLFRAFVEKQLASRQQQPQRRRETFDICRDDDEFHEDDVDAAPVAEEQEEEEKICIPRYHQDSNNVTLLWQKNMFFTELSLKRHSSDVPFALFFKTSSSSSDSDSSLRRKFIAKKNRTNHSRNRKREGLLWIHEDLLPSHRMKPVIPSNNNDLLFPQSHVEFGFNLMVQQVIGSSLAFDPSRTREEVQYFKNFYPDDY